MLTCKCSQYLFIYVFFIYQWPGMEWETDLQVAGDPPKNLFIVSKNAFLHFLNFFKIKKSYVLGRISLPTSQSVPAFDHYCVVCFCNYWTIKFVDDDEKVFYNNKKQNICIIYLYLHIEITKNKIRKIASEIIINWNLNRIIIR
jgi:hypothetical protein